MKAIVIDTFGDAGVLRLADLEKPSVARNEVLVRVEATSVNPIDWKIRQYGIEHFSPSQFPLVLGLDVAGVVSEVGSEVTRFVAGDRVMAYINMDKMGAYAEYAAVPEEELTRIPPELDFITAAALPVAGVTAAEAILVKADIQPGQTILIHAAAGGVGSLAVQLARAKGAIVYATASPSNHAFLEDLGATRVVDYRQPDYLKEFGEVDIVMDGVGGQTQLDSYRIIRKGGLLVSITDVPDPRSARQFGISAVHVWANPNSRLLDTIAAMTGASQLRAVVSEVFPLKDMKQAHLLSETGHVKGKLVLHT